MRQRKLMLPPFHGERMQRYGELMREIAEHEIASWPRGAAVRPAPAHAGDHARDHHARGLRHRATPSGSRACASALRAAARHRHDQRRALLRSRCRSVRDDDRARRTVAAFRAASRSTRSLYDEIARRRAAPDLAERDDVLSLLLQARHEDGAPMSDEELRDELMTLLVAGHETTATALAWAFERLVRHPARAGAAAPRRSTPASDDYLDAVIKETLRLRPVLPVVVRLLTRPLELGGYDAARRRARRAQHLPVPPPPGRVPGAGALRPERFLERPAGTYSWIPSAAAAPLPRRELSRCSR